MSDLRNIIRQLAQPDGETVAMVCTVDEVDKTARTVDCTPINEGAPLLGVNLQANQGADFGLCLFPEKGSFVVVGFVADGAAGVVLLTERIESAEIVIGDISAVIDKSAVSFNGGRLGGLVKVEDLTTRLNLIENSVNDLKNIIAAWVPVTQDGGAALKSAITSWAASPLAVTARSDYENEKVKQ